jgi:beta-glucosidase/6-phospho-beta-glucosidase/beta-galactosidase
MISAPRQKPDPGRAYLPSGSFASFFMGGFECSSQRRRDRKRIDLLAATGHDRWAAADYAQLRDLGLRTLRDGVRWHLVEPSRGHFDWSSFLPMLRAANHADVQVIWDLMHYGWPDRLDIFSASFISRFEQYTAAVARLVRDESDRIPYYCPINEISFFAWAGGGQRLMKPFRTREADRLKQQLVRASIAAIEAIRAVDPRARIVHAEPVIHVAAASHRHIEAAKDFTSFQFQSMDMMVGSMAPEIGGHPKYLDLLGVNYYPENQWYFSGGTIPMGHHRYRPLREMLAEVHARYGRPLLIAETGAEGTARAAWLHYVTAEVLAAKLAGTRIEGLCLYPVTDYPGWENERPCETGLVGSADENGNRSIYRPLLDELACSAARLRAAGF